jgi:iron complex transport system permease protein
VDVFIPPAADPPPPARSGLLQSGWARASGLLVALAGVAAVAGCSFVFGSKPIPVGTVIDAFLHYDGSNDHLIVRSLRVPRTLIGLGVGAALGLAGTVMQGMSRNPLADPALLGIEQGASLAVVLAISAFGIGSLTGYVWFAFAGAALGGVLVYTLGSSGRGGATPVKLALAGTAVSALLSSFTWAILLLDVATLDRFRFWVVGSLAGRGASIAGQVAPFLAVGIVLALASARSLNTLALGEDVARALGQRVGVARATAAAGPIAFVGLTVPHVARAICGPDHRWVLPWSMVLAPCLLLGSDVLGRVVARPGELQVGIVTALVGAPFFVALVRRRKLAAL